MARRHGVSLVEFLVAIAIVALLIGLLLPAIQSARRTAEQIKNKNAIRQILVAQHHYASDNDGRLPGFVDSKNMYAPGNAPLYVILPYIDGNYRLPLWKMTDRGMAFPPIPLYLSEADPTYARIVMPEFITPVGLSSFAFNMTAFTGPPTLSGSFSDGTTNTIAFAEHYNLTFARNNMLSYVGNLNDYRLGETWATGVRNASFADAGFYDVIPVTAGDPARTLPSVRGKTFQHMPKFEDSDGRLPQSMHPSGLVVGMMDGSVRTISPGVDEAIFWGAVTPNGGEVLSDW